jgi:hypothetical protein
MRAWFQPTAHVQRRFVRFDVQFDGLTWDDHDQAVHQGGNP